MSHPIRILLAEDEEHIAKLILFKLKKEGYSVTWAEDGERALETIRASGFDLIILDIMMPKLDGWQVLKAIRESEMKVPVLMLTAKGSDQDVTRSTELGATRFLRKPFDPAGLVKTLRELLSFPLASPNGAGECEQDFAHLRDEFIESFQSRRHQVIGCLADLCMTDDLKTAPPSVCRDLQVIAHNIAGVAKNYGFPILGQLSIETEDSLGDRNLEIDLSHFITKAEKLEQALQICHKSRQDLRTTSFGEFLVFESTP